MEMSIRNVDIIFILIFGSTIRLSIPSFCVSKFFLCITDTQKNFDTQNEGMESRIVETKIILKFFWQK